MSDARLSLRPRKLKPGLINMKYQAITFGPLYAGKDPRFMDRMAEMMNLSDGTRSIADIARVRLHLRDRRSSGHCKRGGVTRSVWRRSRHIACTRCRIRRDCECRRQ